MTSRLDYITSIRQSLDNYCEACQASVHEAPDYRGETDALEKLDRVSKMLANWKTIERDLVESRS